MGLDKDKKKEQPEKIAVIVEGKKVMLDVDKAEKYLADGIRFDKLSPLISQLKF